MRRAQGSTSHHEMAARIAALDPITEAATVYRLTTLFDFPFELRFGLNLAFYRTFAIPSIAAVLAESGQIGQHPRKRAYDTGLFMYELIESGGFDTRTARDVVSGLNRAHRHWEISNEDFLYVLAAFVVVPARWINQFGWRQLTGNELTAMAAFYTELGTRMGIRNIPETYQAFADLLDEYERAHLAPSFSGISHMSATNGIIAGRLPRPLRRLAPLLTSAVTDDRICRSLGIKPANALAKNLAKFLLRVRGVIVRRMPARKTSWFVPGTRAGSVYPRGYTIADLGPAERPQSSESSGR